MLFIILYTVCIGLRKHQTKKRVIKMDKNRTLKKQLSLIFILLSIIPIVILGIYHGAEIRNSISQSAKSQKYATQRLSEVVETYVSFHTNYLESISYNISRSPEMDRDGMSMLLEGAKTKLPGFMELYVGNKNGIIIASFPEEDRQRELHIGSDISKRDHFKTVKKAGRTIITPILAGRHSGTPMIMIAAPVNRGDDFDGYVLGLLDLSALSKIITDYDYGRGAYPVVIDQEQKIIYHPDLPVITKNYDLGIFKKKVGRERAASGEGKYYSSAYQREEYASYEKIGTLHWYAYVSRPVAIMNEGYWQALFLLLGVILFTLLLTQFLSWRLSKKMLGPVAVLMDYSSAFEKGTLLPDDFGQVKLRSAAREFHLLLARFQEMGRNVLNNKAKLLELNRELEIRVEERTERLKAKNTQLGLINSLIEHPMPIDGTDTFLGGAMARLSEYLGERIAFYKQKDSIPEECHTIEKITFGHIDLGWLVAGEAGKSSICKESREFLKVYARPLGIVLYNHFLLSNLRKQNGILKTVTENMNDGFILLDRQYGISYANALLANTLALENLSLSGRLFSELAPLIQFSGCGMEEAFLSILDEGRDQVHFTIEAGSGTRHLMMAKFILNDAGEKLGFGIVLQDMTKEKEVDELKNRLISFTSHEYKTPITTLKGSVETLLRKDVEWEADFIDELLDGMMDDIQRLEQLTSDWLDIVKIDSNALVLIKEETRIGSFIEGVLFGLRKPPFTNAAILFDMANSANPVVSFDLKRVEQIVRNLITNSIRYSKEEARTEIRIYESTDVILIEFIDNGIGIAAEHLDKIFDKFYHVDASRTRKSGGTGLGLAICKGIADAHGWGISVKSKVGVGSTFTLKIPKERQAIGHEI